MGYFTWTDAQRNPKKLKCGDYSSADKIGYGGYAKVVCPDNTEIIEPYYEGYGMFDGKDIYDLVVDWNKAYLKDIFDKKDKGCYGYHLKTMAIAYQNDDAVTLQEEIDELIKAGKEPNWFKDEWKREIGITIACDTKDNRRLPFPIKITATKWHRTYDELVPSHSCQ